MANKEHLAKLKGKKGVKGWNEWRAKHPRVRPDLREADLGLADLSGANLSHASLRRAYLIQADLSHANLRDANLLEADLRSTNLFGASLIEASLFNAYFLRADLTEADFTRAELGNTTLESSDLSSTKGLETVKHLGRSTIGIDTIYKSQGKIPESFLRGAGVPEIFIEYLPSLVAPGAIQFYSCFISYSTKDQGFAERLHADLQSKGVRCWFAPHKVRGGEKLRLQLDEAIRLHEKLLLILSPDSIGSEWVKLEIRAAREREIREGKRVLFPVRLVSYEDVVQAVREWALYDGKDGKDFGG